MYRKYLPLCMLVLAPLLQGCPKDADKITETLQINQWVYDHMDRHYLWAGELPEREESRMETPTQEFFDKNLRYRSNKGVPLVEDKYGDRFSNIKYVGKEEASSRAAEVTEQDFDFGFLLSSIRYEGKLDHLQVLYVIPGKPADRAGLRRGDAFRTINGKDVRDVDYKSLLASPTVTLKIINRRPGVEITMSKELFYNHPILLDTIYENITPKTAYLLYTHFTDGADVGGGGYARELKAAFARYKADGVKNLILDLRYNGGGEVDNAELLASLIVPQTWLGKTFMYLQNNRGDLEQRKLMNTNEIRASNADIENLYIITSKNTASASEMIIHTMRPIFGDNLRVVGETTYGKNVGGHTIKSSQYDWEINPITLRVYNLENKSGYETGIVPDTGKQDDEYLFDPNFPGYWMLPPLGDYEHEYLLNLVMSRIDQSVPGVNASRSGSRSMNELTHTPMVPIRELKAGTIVVD